MNYRMIIYILGKFMLVCALLMLLPLIVTVIFKENNYWSFIIPFMLFFVSSILFSYKRPNNSYIYAKEGFVIVVLCWIILALIGSLPFYLSNLKLSYVDCVFETVSGITTTGSSIIPDVEILPKGILFWRSFTNWIGGMGVLVFMLAVMPRTGTHDYYLLAAEVPGPKFGKLVPKLKYSVMILYGIYIFLTLLLFIILVVVKMPIFDSLLTSFATAGTGGFAIKNTSLGFYNSAYIESIIGIFMILFGINFNLYYLILLRQISRVFKNEELKWFIGIIATSVVLITFNITPLYKNITEAFRHAFFQVSSIISTTGFSTTDFNLWPTFSITILILLMFIGGCAGSTAGGLKVSRIVILIKSVLREKKYMFSPHSVNSIKFEGEALNDTVVRGVRSYFTVHMIITAISLLIISLEKIDFLTAFSSVVTSINNIGPGFGLVGPMSNFSNLSDLTKLVLTFDMLAGRLEFFPVLILFSPSTWRGYQ